MIIDNLGQITWFVISCTALRRSYHCSFNLCVCVCVWGGGGGGEERKIDCSFYSIQDLSYSRPAQVTNSRSSANRNLIRVLSYWWSLRMARLYLVYRSVFCHENWIVLSHLLILRKTFPFEFVSVMLKQKRSLCPLFVMLILTCSSTSSLVNCLLASLSCFSKLCILSYETRQYHQHTLVALQKTLSIPCFLQVSLKIR